MSAADYRVFGDDSLTSDAEVYQVLEADDLNPGLPVRVRLDVTGHGAYGATVSTNQPGPWPDNYADINLDLQTLVTLGEIATALLAGHECGNRSIDD